MFTLSAFADEIDPDPLKQIDILKICGVRHIEFRSILGTNVLALSDLQIQEFKALLDKNGFKLSAIGSPIGKIKIDDPFEPHLEKFKRAIHLCGVFGTKNIRVFSYYPPDGFDGNWTKWRGEVMSRMTQKCELAQKAGVRLIHENEHRIYGDSPERVTDMMTTLRKTFGADVIGAVHDPANFVFCGYDPWQGWLASKPWLVHFHIKDWIAKAEHGSLAGEGQSRIPEVIADAVKMGYSGFATMEPHLLGGGPTGGVTGPELFPKAVAAFKKILEGAGQISMILNSASVIMRMHDGFLLTWSFFMATSTADTKLKKAIKQAFAESLQENRELIYDVIVEAMEDVGLLRAMEAGRKTKLVPRKKVFAILRGKK